MTEIKTIKANGHTLIVVPVPEDADISDCEIIRDQDNFELKQFKYPSDKYHGLQNYSWVDIGKENYTVLGTITSNYIDFDPSDYTEYMWGDLAFDRPTKKRRFRELLQSHNINLETGKCVILLKQ